MPTSPDRGHTAGDGAGPYDVIVVGAGLAGLTAAVHLHDHGRQVLVLEADSRVGGRTETGHFADGQWIELGGQWVAAQHTELRALIDRFGLSLASTVAPGRVVSLYRGRRHVNRAMSSPPLPRRSRNEVRHALAKLRHIVESVNLESPWLTPDAIALDRQTFDTWIHDELSTAAGRDSVRTACEAIFAPDPVEVSTLHAAVYLRSGDHLRRLAQIDRDAQEVRVVGGAAAISDRMSDHLGSAVRLNAQVREIVHSGATVTVHCRRGDVFTAARVIVSIPPTLAGRLDYRPIMPSVRDQLTQRLHSISVVKLHLAYETRFWRARGLSGEAVCDVGPIRVILDNTPPNSTHGILVSFIEGADRLDWALRSPDARRAAFIEAAVRVFGPEAAHPVDYIERDWSAEEFTRGCYHGHFSPSTWTTYGPALTEPVGAIHWAGTETAREWTGYMEGAVRSGIRAADEVMAHLA